MQLSINEQVFLMLVIVEAGIYPCKTAVHPYFGVRNALRYHVINKSIAHPRHTIELHLRITQNSLHSRSVMEMFRIFSQKLT